MSVAATGEHLIWCCQLESSITEFIQLLLLTAQLGSHHNRTCLSFSYFLLELAALCIPVGFCLSCSWWFVCSVSSSRLLTVHHLFFIDSIQSVHTLIGLRSLCVRPFVDSLQRVKTVCLHLLIYGLSAPCF